MDGYQHPVVSRETPPTMADILCAVAEEFRVSPDELRGTGRSRSLIFPRQGFYWLAHKIGTWSSVQIGRATGGRDHTTVLYGIKAASDRMVINPSYAATLTRLWDQFASHHPQIAKKICPHCGGEVG